MVGGFFVCLWGFVVVIFCLGFFVFSFISGYCFFGCLAGNVYLKKTNNNSDPSPGILPGCHCVVSGDAWLVEIMM